MEIEKIAAQAPQSRSMANATAAAPAGRKLPEDSRLQALMHLKTIVDVRCSILAEYWPWDDVPPMGTRFQGRMTRWASKDECRLYVKWEDRESGTAECLVDPKDGTSFLLDPRFQFRLEQYDDGRPVPTPPLVAGPFLLAQHNLQDAKVLEARADAIVAPAAAYYNSRFNGTRCDQLTRMKACQFLDPLFAKGNPPTEANVDALGCFRLYSHPRVAPHL